MKDITWFIFKLDKVAMYLCVAED